MSSKKLKSLVGILLSATLLTGCASMGGSRSPASSEESHVDKYERRTNHLGRSAL